MIVNSAASRFSAKSLVTLIKTFELFQVDAGDSAYLMVANQCAVKIAQLTVKQVLFVDKCLRSRDTPFHPVITGEERSNCEMKLEALLERVEVKSLVDGLKYATILTLSSALQKKIIDRLLSCQNIWTKEATRDIIELLMTVQSLKNDDYERLRNPALVKGTKLASYYSPNQLIIMLNEMAMTSHAKLDCVQFFKTAAERAVRERWSCNLLKPMTKSYSRIGFVDETFLQFFADEILRTGDHDKENIHLFATLNFQPRNLDALLESFIDSPKRQEVSKNN